VVASTPEHVAAHPTSYTGQFLARLVAPERVPAAD
jgi:excinuclease ABC subunit A